MARHGEQLQRVLSAPLPVLIACILLVGWLGSRGFVERRLPLALRQHNTSLAGPPQVVQRDPPWTGHRSSSVSVAQGTTTSHVLPADRAHHLQQHHAPATSLPSQPPTSTALKPSHIGVRGTVTEAAKGVKDPLLGIISSKTPNNGDTAVCIVGGIRSLYFKAVYLSILHKAIDQLRPARVFFVLNKWRSVDDNGEGHGVQIPDNPPMDRVYQALAAFEPSFVELHEGSDCHAMHKVEPGRLCCDKEVSSFMQLHWIQHCFEEVERYEAKHRIRFDIFVRLRPDVFYFDAFPRREVVNRSDITLAMKWAWNQPADWLFIVTRKGLGWFTETYGQLSKRCQVKRQCRERLDSLTLDGRKSCLKPDGHFGAPEYSSWYRQSPEGTFVTASGSRFPFRSIDVSPIIVRAPHKADCFRSLSRFGPCQQQSQRGWDS
mmetsp:Transcript_103797/g.289084  ORF Transcript_103797/g.289084 Transcript_103797/m.289084 type:complete len:432 (-) Transcript_103797:64-1359(-)